MEQIVDIPGGGLRDFRPGQSSSSFSNVPARVHEGLDGPGEGFFRTFPQYKKSAASASSPSPRVPASVSSSTPAPQNRVRLWEWVMILTDPGLTIGIETRGRHAGRWRTDTRLLGGCGLMAAMWRSSRFSPRTRFSCIILISLSSWCT